MSNDHANSPDFGRALTLLELGWVMDTADSLVNRMRVEAIINFPESEQERAMRILSTELERDKTFASLSTEWQRIVMAEILAVLARP